MLLSLRIQNCRFFAIAIVLAWRYGEVVGVSTFGIVGSNPSQL
jgi:hypothetical protein